MEKSKINYMVISQNDKASDFTLPDQNGKMQTLSDYKGKWVLIYFYPRDFTPGCTTEACSIRDNWNEFSKKGIVVLGISKDSIESHKKFAEKYKLPFTILADPDKKVLEAYGVWQKKKFMGKEYMGTARISYLINPEGKIAKIYEKVNPLTHAQEILKL